MTDDEKLELLNRAEDACWDDINQYGDDKLLQEIMTENYLATIERCQRIRTGIQSVQLYSMSDEERKDHAESMSYSGRRCAIPKGQCPVCD